MGWQAPLQLSAYPITGNPSFYHQRGTERVALGYSYVHPTDLDPCFGSNPLWLGRTTTQSGSGWSGPSELSTYNSYTYALNNVVVAVNSSGALSYSVRDAVQDLNGDGSCYDGDDYISTPIYSGYYQSSPAVAGVYPFHLLIDGNNSIFPFASSSTDEVYSKNSSNQEELILSGSLVDRFAVDITAGHIVAIALSGTTLKSNVYNHTNVWTGDQTAMANAFHNVVEFASNGSGQGLVLGRYGMNVRSLHYSATSGWSSAVETVATEASTPLALTASIHSSGAAVAVWRVQESGRYNLYAATYSDSEGWSGKLSIENQSADCNLATSAAGVADVIVAYSCGTSSIFVIRFKPGSGWTTPQMVASVTEIMQTIFEVAIAPSGKAYIVVTSRESGSDYVFGIDFR